MITLEELEELVGAEIPAGSFTIEGYEHWLCADAVLSPPLPEGVAHPMYGYYTAIAGMGISLDEMFQMVGSSADAGVLFGEGGLTFMEPLRVGETYDVSGEIRSIKRKEGKRAGIFDIVEFELRVIDPAGVTAAISSNSFVFPRGQS